MIRTNPNDVVLHTLLLRYFQLSSKEVIGTTNDLTRQIDTLEATIKEELAKRENIQCAS